MLIEVGFLEAVAREPFHWLQKNHNVMAAIYANAMDPKRKDQKEWCEYWFSRLKQMSDEVAPFKNRKPKSMKEGPATIEVIDDGEDEDA